MPKLILFTPCQKIVVDEVDKTTTIICVLEAIQVGIPLGNEADVPADATIPVSWDLLALWQSEEGDAEKRFETRFSLQFGAGEPQHMAVAIPFAFEEGKPNFRNVVKLNGMPLTPLLATDVCLVMVSLREQGEDEWQVRGDFPIIIKRPPAPAV